MWPYYRELLRKTPRIFTTAWRQVTLWSGIVGAVILAFNGPIIRMFEPSAQGISYWWGVIPVATLFAYGTLRANYDEIERLRSQAPDAKRLAIKNFLGVLLREGKTLRVPADCRAWETRAYAFLERSLGTAEAELFTTFDRSMRMIGGDPPHWQQMSRLNRLVALIGRMDEVAILPDYRGEP